MGGQVVVGDVIIISGVLQIFIEQLFNKVVINWDDFSIDFGELVKFIYQNSSDVIFNWVIGDIVF